MKKIVFNRIKEYCNKIINSELFIIIIGFLLFIKTAIFYKLTIYISDSINKELLAKIFIFSMFIVSVLFLFRKNRLRFFLALFVDLVFSLIAFADNLYYSYSSSLISISQVSNLQYSEQISAVLKDLLNKAQIFYFLDIIVIIMLLITKFIKLEKTKTKGWKSAIVYFSVMMTIYCSTIPTYVEASQSHVYNKKMQLELGTVYTFHYLDFKTNMNLKKTAKYATNGEMMIEYEKLKNEYSENYQEDLYNLKDIAKGKNVIVLQLESFQNFLLYKEINGKEITPNLNKFMNENIYFKNMIIQSYSTTADSEHSAMSSLYPLENGMAFAQYSANEYDDFYGEYKQSGYYTMYTHGNDGEFWNRNNVYGKLDIDELDFIDNFDEDSTLINGWISDESLYNQVIKNVEKVNKPFFINIVSASSHTAFDLPGLDNKYEYIDIDVGKFKDTYFGNYLEAVNYADNQFGKFIEQLKEKNLYDNSMILVYGDHYGMQMYNYEMLDYLEEVDYKYNNIETEINYINTVCGLRIPGVEHMVIDKTISKLDIKPTICYLSGVKDGISLGTNMFGSKDFACLNNGIIVTDEYYFNGEWYYRKNGEKLDLSSLDEKQQEKIKNYERYMNTEMNISNSIILNNLLK